MRKSETIVKKDLAYFLPHMSAAALSSFIALRSEAGLWFAIEAEYRPEGRWNGYSLAICPGSGRTSAVTITPSLCPPGAFVFGCHGSSCLVVSRGLIVFIVYMGG